MNKLNKNEDLFLTFIIKEKELAEIKKQNAQLVLKYVSLKHKSEKETDNWINKILQLIKDSLTHFKLKYIENKNNKSIKNLTDEDKIDKIINVKTFKQQDFKIYYINLRRFQEKKIIQEGPSANISNFEYESFVRIEFNDLITTRHLKKTFTDPKKAQEYFKKLVEENKNKKVRKLLDELTQIMDNEIDELKEINKKIKFKITNL